MGFSYGRTSLGMIGRSVQLLANSRGSQFKPGGLTLDWTTVPVNNGANVVWDDGVTVETGFRGLRFGQCLCRITGQEVQTVAFSTAPTSGNFIVWGVDPHTGNGNEYSLPYNPTTAQFQTAMDFIFGTGNTVVGGTTGTGPFTVTTAGALLNSSLALLQFDVTNNGALGAMGVTYTGGVPAPIVTGGGGGQNPGAGLNAGVTISATITAGSNSGMYGPYDNTATDGRQTLARGAFYWLNASVLEQDTISNHPGVIEAGLVFRDRLIATTGTASLTNGPTFAAWEPLMPGIRYVVND